jgi:single-strand selective monofunctional uracil DNA glycosylase
VARPGAESLPAVPVSQALVESAIRLRDAVQGLRFSPPVTHVYNPLDYAWAAHELYLRKYGRGRKRVLFLGMNPGPFGMVQVAVPFGAIPRVRDWLRIEAPVGKPAHEHPKRPVTGFNCKRIEVSGDRFWGLMQRRFVSAKIFFTDHFVVNYCPLAFMEATGKNRTPDRLPAAEQEPLFAACDEHLRRVVAVLRPEWVIGVGGFADARAREVLGDNGLKFGRILHPAPANPAANREPGWGETTAARLRELGLDTF